MYANNEFDGFDDLSKQLQDCVEKIEENHLLEILEYGAKQFVSDLLKLPKPKSRINANGYTHLVNTFAYRTKGKQIEVGWGKYYGPMVEDGTRRMKAQPHLVKLFENQKEKYYKSMIEKLDL